MPDMESLKEIGLSEDDVNGGFLYRGKGCSECLDTGYKGRTGIYEMLFVNESLRSTILHTSESNIIREKGIENGMISLRKDGAAKVLDGITTIEEVLRVTQE